MMASCTVHTWMMELYPEHLIDSHICWEAGTGFLRNVAWCWMTVADGRMYGALRFSSWEKQVISNNCMHVFDQASGPYAPHQSLCKHRAAFLHLWIGTMCTQLLSSLVSYFLLHGLCQAFIHSFRLVFNNPILTIWSWIPNYKVHSKFTSGKYTQVHVICMSLLHSTFPSYQ
jgi:hypothetical protein